MHIPGTPQFGDLLLCMLTCTAQLRGRPSPASWRAAAVQQGSRGLPGTTYTCTQRLQACSLGAPPRLASRVLPTGPLPGPMMDW